jgi:hypothetical protein
MLQGTITEDPFRRGLGEALLWIDMLQRRVEGRVEMEIERGWETIVKGVPQNDEKTDITVDAGGADSMPLTAAQQSHEQETSKTPATLAACARKLQRLCPACFGGSQFGTPLSE